MPSPYYPTVTATVDSLTYGDGTGVLAVSIDSQSYSSLEVVVKEHNGDSPTAYACNDTITCEMANFMQSNNEYSVTVVGIDSDGPVAEGSNTLRGKNKDE